MRSLAVAFALCGCNSIFGINTIAPPPSDGSAVLPPGRWAFTAATYGSTFAIDLDGALWAWGENIYGDLGINSQSIEVPQLTRVGTDSWIDVTSGWMHACGRHGDGSLWCWGSNQYGEVGGGGVATTVTAPVAIGAGAWASVCSGTYHTCGIQADGSLWCWGQGMYGQLGNAGTTNAASPTKVDSSIWVTVACGQNHTCAIRNDQSLWCWGDNTFGELGDGSTTSRLSPGVVDSGIHYDRVAAGALFTCAVRSDQHLRCWGYNSMGQLGTDDTSAHLTPTPADADSGGWIDVVANLTHACGLRSDGSARCWGDDSNGELGTTSPTGYITVPNALDVGSPETWSQVAAGGAHTCAISHDHNLWCTGADALSQLGDAPAHRVPSLVAGNWHAPVARGYSACATDSAGTVSCWGYNGDGELGDGTRLARQQPTAAFPSPATAPTLAGDGICALSGTSDWCSGANLLGDFGDGTTVPAMAPRAVPDPQGWQVIAAGAESRCALDLGSNLWCWGGNRYGELAIAADSGPHATPVQIASGYGQVALGDYHTCGVAGSNVTCWGWNAFGQLGDGTMNSRSVAATVTTPLVSPRLVLGGNQSCALDAAGMAACWGNNSSGQLGVGTSSIVLQPAIIPGQWIHLALGANHTCGISIDHSLWCWGDNAFGELGDGGATIRLVPEQIGGNTDWDEVAAGNAFSCATNSRHQLYCWGDNAYGSLGNGQAWRDSFALIP